MSNILHIGLGADNGVYGDRTPGIWFLSNTTRLYISNAINGNKDYIGCIGSAPKIGKNNFFTGGEDLFVAQAKWKKTKKIFFDKFIAPNLGNYLSDE